MQGKFEADGKKRRRLWLGGRTVVLLMTLVLVLGCAIGGTLAWLLDASGEVKNTFTPSNISITLEEDAGADDYEFQMVPGHVIEKDPIVTVKDGSEDCWVFIKVEESPQKITVGEGNEAKEYTFKDFISYTIDTNNWTELTDDNGKKVEGVYYCCATDITADRAIKILGEGTWKDDEGNSISYDPNHVLVLPTVTKQMMSDLTENNYPTLTFKAYACQYWQSNDTPFDVYEAWQQASSTGTP